MSPLINTEDGLEESKKVGRPNRGYHAEKLSIHLRCDWVETMEKIAEEQLGFTNRQDVIREAVRQYLKNQGYTFES